MCSLSDVKVQLEPRAEPLKELSFRRVNIVLSIVAKLHIDDAFYSIAILKNVLNL